MDKLNCMLCDKELWTLYDDYREESDNHIIQGGSHDRICPGYGSRFDDTKIDVVLCDDCIEKHFINKQLSNKKDD